MSIVMKLWGSARGGSTPYDWQYLESVDFEAHGGQAQVTLTPSLAKAMRFADMQEAFALYRRSPECQPLRSDGKPNRPLTAWNWEFSHDDA